jgi:tetratricopeptide (TPR) repeat protein
MYDLLKRIVDILENHAGWKTALGVTILLFGTTASYYIASNEFTPKQILAVTFWIPLSFLYVAVFYRARLGKHILWVFVIAIAASVGWCIEFARYRGSTNAGLHGLMQQGDGFEGRGLHNEASTFYMRCASRALLLGDTDLERSCICALAKTQAANRDAKAKITLNVCVSFSALGPAPISAADALVMLGDFETEESKYDEAYADYERGAEIYAAQQNTVGRATIERAYGDLSNLRGDTAEAMRRYEMALELYRQQGAHQGIANVFLRLGETAAATDKADEARTDFDNARWIYFKQGDKLGQANALYSWGRLSSNIDERIESAGRLQAAASLYADEGMMDRAEQASSEARAVSAKSAATIRNRR